MVKNKKGQEEMVGFALIIIIVAVILLVFLAFSLRTPQTEAVESYEVESFLKVVLQYTTDCKDSGTLEYLEVKDLIANCRDKKNCENGKNSCELLEEIFSGAIEKGWDIGEESPYKASYLLISSEEEEIFSLGEEIENLEYKGFNEMFEKRGRIEVEFDVYY
jgi:hypothetical protein